MTTYNQAIAILAEIAEAHLQIQQFGKGSLADIPEGMEYPYMWAQYEPTAVNLSTRSDKISFNILFADLLHNDKSNEVEILSDQKQIALDIVAQLQLEAYRDKFEVEDGVTLEPIVEKIGTDSTAGWLMNITLRVDYLSDTCQVPSTLSPADEQGCPSVGVYDSAGVLLATVQAGLSYTVTDTTVKNSAGTTIGTGRAQSIITLADKTLSNSDASFTSPIVQGINKTLSDITILEGDGVSRTHPAAVNRTTSQRTFTLTATLRASSRLETALKIESQGEIKSASNTNVSAYVVKRVRAGVIATVTVPFTVQEDDILHISATPTNAALDAVVSLVGFHDVLTSTITQPISNGNYRYLYNLNYVDQTVSVTDLSDHTNEATITLPSGNNFSSMVCQDSSQVVWVFGTNYYARIDCNPSSGTFNTVLTHGSILISTLQSACAHDYINDMLWIGRDQSLFKVNPSTLAVTNIGSTAGISPPIAVHMYYIESIKGLYVGGAASGQLIISTETDSSIYGQGIGDAGNMMYNYSNGKIYHCGGDQMIVRSANPVKQLAAISMNNLMSRNAVALVPGVNKAFAGNVSNNNIGIVNTSTDTSGGSVAKTSPATNETATRQTVYSPFSDRVYVMGLASGNQTTGVDRIHIINPNTNAYQGFVTVGNMDATNSHLFWGHQMCLNGLIP